MKQLFFSLVALVALVAWTPDTQSKEGRKFMVMLTGDQEAPNPGDPDGMGKALITINIGRGTLSYQLMVSGIEPATAAHIHEAPRGEAGPVVVGLEAPTSGSSSGTITSLSREELKEIMKNPEDCYINVHNADFPGGALRGQLR